MKVSYISVGALAATSLLLGLSRPASAQLFRFTTSMTDGGSGTSPAITATTIPTTLVGNYYNFTNGADATNDNADNSGFGTDIVLTNYTATAPSTSSGTVDRTYSLDITLTDAATNQSQTKTVTGKYSGSLSLGASTLAQTFDQTSLIYTFSTGTYVVNNFDILSPGPPGSTTVGGTGAHVLFTAASSAAPEPGSFVMAGAGLLGMGLVRLRRRC